MTPFSGDPDLLLTFLAFKRFVFLEVLSVLALLRVIRGPGLARWPALVAFGLSVAGVATTFAPALGLTGTAGYAQAARAMAEGGGMAALLVPAALYAISAISPRAGWRWMDVVFALLLAVLLGLWWWTS
ncbi:hypothetical protein [Ponticoccus alexandrii]|uniref:hypothetical protein n=1 Tax=Ponticoccus alexandrii TaxID=1943633 RepID=UPI0003D1B514|nr:hypothetical protein [Ponticoccus alexandrii]ETA51545.1 hypothetical protein P279_13490 [Rhodobacteraceae bacterium PD-2]